MIIGTTILGLIVLLYVLSQIILIGSFVQLEEKNVKQNIERGKNAIIDDINRIESISIDWAAWDDSYNFVQNSDEAYIKSNLDPSTLVNLHINFMLFYNISGHLIYGEGVDIKNKKKAEIPEVFQNDLSPNDILLKHTETNSTIKGIIILPEGPTLIASRPIITSEYQGPIRGSLIVGRFLDSEEIGYLSNITQLSLSSSFYDPNNSDFLSTIQLLSKEKPILIRPKSNDIIVGSILLNDIEGNPAIIIKAEMPREIHKQGDNTMKYLIFSIIGSGLVFGLVTLLLLEKNVLSPLAFLSSNVSAIGASSDRSMRLSMPGNDELSNLAKVINGMLEELEKAEEAKTKQLLLKEIYHRVKNNLQIVISLLNLQSQKTKDKNVIEIFKDSQNRIRSMALIHERLYKSKNLGGINLKEYIQDLSSNLLRSYGVNLGSVNLKLDIDDIILNLDTATPCGLIVTELVSNSLKHAFPKGQKGELLIRFISDNNDTFILIVRDNGIGFPENIDFRKTNTLGMQLVTSLVNQLKGTIELDRSNGTEFKITFKEKQEGVVENG
jgi:two-component sensor histidine kinase/sensor domain CHASE-containing protein